MRLVLKSVINPTFSKKKKTFIKETTENISY